MNVKSLFVLGLGALAFAACSNDDDPVEKQDETVVVNLAKQADYTIYSGETTLKTSFGQTRANMPTDTTYSIDYDQVEVNLSVNDPRVNTENPYDYVATKLSIHVRDTTDVTVFIPVTEDLYCDADDMAIVGAHKDTTSIVYNTEPTTVSMTLGGNTVTLTVAYSAEGITVKTEGMNAAVLAYTKENYKDGLTFEVWNYYNEDATREGIKGLANNSTVTFDEAPGFYINGFNKILDYKDPVYDKVDSLTGVRTPYKDEALTEELDETYYTRDASDNRYYILTGTPSANDCTVKPTDADLKESTVRIRSEYNKIYTIYNDKQAK